MVHAGISKDHSLQKPVNLGPLAQLQGELPYRFGYQVIPTHSIHLPGTNAHSTNSTNASQVPTQAVNP